MHEPGGPSLSHSLFKCKFVLSGNPFLSFALAACANAHSVRSAFLTFEDSFFDFFVWVVYLRVSTPYLFFLAFVFFTTSYEDLFNFGTWCVEEPSLFASNPCHLTLIHVRTVADAWASGEEKKSVFSHQRYSTLESLKLMGVSGTFL